VGKREGVIEPIIADVYMIYVRAVLTLC